MPGRGAGAVEDQAQAGVAGDVRERLSQRIQRGVVGIVGADLHRQVALREAAAHSGHLAARRVPVQRAGKERGHHHRRIGQQGGGQALGRQCGLGGGVAHGQRGGEPQLGHQRSAGRRRLLRQVGAARRQVGHGRAVAAGPGWRSAAGLHARARRHIALRRAADAAAHRIGPGRLGAQGLRRPQRLLARPRLQMADGRIRLVGRQQHGRGLPGGAGEHLAADVQQGSVAPGRLARQAVQRGDGMAAHAAQVPVGQPGMGQRAARLQRGDEVPEQQVAEVVAVEGAEKDPGAQRAAHAAAPALAFSASWPRCDP